MNGTNNTGFTHYYEMNVTNRLLFRDVLSLKF